MDRDAKALFCLLYWGFGYGLAWFGLVVGRKGHRIKPVPRFVLGLFLLGLAAVWRFLQFKQPWFGLFMKLIPESIRWPLYFLPGLPFWGLGIAYLYLAAEPRPLIEVPGMPYRTIRIAAFCFGFVSVLSMLPTLLWLDIGVGAALSRFLPLR